MEPSRWNPPGGTLPGEPFRGNPPGAGLPGGGRTVDVTLGQAERSPPVLVQLPAYRIGPVDATAMAMSSATPSQWRRSMDQTSLGGLDLVRRARPRSAIDFAEAVAAPRCLRPGGCQGFRANREQITRCQRSKPRHPLLPGT